LLEELLGALQGSVYVVADVVAAYYFVEAGFLFNHRLAQIYTEKYSVEIGVNLRSKQPPIGTDLHGKIFCGNRC